MSLIDTDGTQSVAGPLAVGPKCRHPHPPGVKDAEASAAAAFDRDSEIVTGKWTLTKHVYCRVSLACFAACYFCQSPANLSPPVQSTFNSMLGPNCALCVGEGTLSARVYRVGKSANAAATVSGGTSTSIDSTTAFCNKMTLEKCFRFNADYRPAAAAYVQLRP